MKILYLFDKSHTDIKLPKDYRRPLEYVIDSSLYTLQTIQEQKVGRHTYYANMLLLLCYFYESLVITPTYLQFTIKIILGTRK